LVLTAASWSAFAAEPVSDKRADTANVTSAVQEHKRIALTVNALNLIVGRYAANLEYQPVPHHGVIVTPHFDHLSGDPLWDGSRGHDRDTLTGGGVELGYRLYTGSRGFNGLFIGPSLLLASHETVLTRNVGTQFESQTRETFSSVGVAMDAGAQWQRGNFVIGFGAGVRSMKNSRSRSFSGSGVDMFIEGNTGEGVYGRFAFNLGCAF
jgi:hypothetical protein